ncbi:MAG: phosphatase PAP2 family protein [Nocardioides sp.]|uniref:phosphatase PAP2 family protein n=1 Tax=Nocardioides sp. TaxID=35761 RepID=UPI0039E2F709
MELALVAGLYLLYTGSRLLANSDVSAALGRARELLHLESGAGLAWEHATNVWFAAHDTIGVIASFWYSSAHYVVTAAVLVWLYTRGREVYLPARRALAAATVVGLGFYLLLPTAPPRMLGGFVDVLSQHASVGWWGADASAPKGLGGLTNELAAFPSLHAGWSLWVAIAVMTATRNRLARALGWAYAAATAVVVVGTANHWTLDVLVGWLVALVGWAVAIEIGRLRHRRHPAESAVIPAESAVVSVESAAVTVQLPDSAVRTTDSAATTTDSAVPATDSAAAGGIRSGRPAPSPRAGRP